MRIDSNVNWQSNGPYFCPLCSTDMTDAALRHGPFWFVRDIPASRLITPIFKERHPRGTCTYWICRRCCKKEGLLW